MRHAVAAVCALAFARAQMQASTPAVTLFERFRLVIVSSLQFEIPMDMLGQMFGGGMQMQRPQESRWPQDVSSEIEADFEWLANTEWQVRRAPIARDGCPQNAWRSDD